MASLTVEGIGKRYGNTPALGGVDLEVADGAFCVLVGPSGCGKSTLLNIIAGLIPQDEGRILFDGKPVDHLAPRERDVAMVFQSYALYPHMTVAGNLGFGLRMRGVPKPTIRTACARDRAPARHRDRCSSENRASSPAGSGSGSPWAGRWCAGQTSFCSTSR